MDNRSLKTSIDIVLREFGFTGKGSTYYLPCADVVLVLSLRKSTHGNYYYLDCGINLCTLSGTIKPKASDCHIQFNFNVLANDEFSTIVKALKVEAAQGDDVANLISLMREQCIPRFLEMSSILALRDMYKQGRLKGTLLLRKAREVLESN